MHHSTQKELIRDSLDTLVGVLCGAHRVHEVSQYSPDRWAELLAWHSNEILSQPSVGVGFRVAHLSFMNRYTRDNLEHWLKTGEYLPSAKISGAAVLNFLQTRGSAPDFMRDTLEVLLAENVVTVKIVDKVSGGSSAHVTDLDPKSFETRYGAK